MGDRLSRNDGDRNDAINGLRFALKDDGGELGLGDGVEYFFGDHRKPFDDATVGHRAVYANHALEKHLPLDVSCPGFLRIGDLNRLDRRGALSHAWPERNRRRRSELTAEHTAHHTADDSPHHAPLHTSHDT